MKKFNFNIALGATLIVIGTNAYAATDSSTVNPTLTISAACTLDTTNLSNDFGTYPSGTNAIPILPLGTIEVTCGSGTSWLLGMDAGVNPTAGNAKRQLSGPASTTLIYDYVATGFGPVGDSGLNAIDPSYTESAASIGNGVSDAGYGVLGTGTGSAQAITMELQILDSDWTGSEPAGAYTDTVVVTVAF